MNKLIVTEYQNQRILTTSQLAESYETTGEIISNNFNRNKDRYQEGKHFYCLEGEQLKEFKLIIKLMTTLNLLRNFTSGLKKVFCFTQSHLVQIKRGKFMTCLLKHILRFKRL